VRIWFVAQTGTVSSSQPGSITPAGLPDVRSCLGLYPSLTRYYLFGQLKMLTHPGEWFYDSASHLLYVWAPHGGPSLAKRPPVADGPHPGVAGQVEVQQRTYGFDLSGVSYTNVDGLRLFGTTARTGPTSTGDVLNHIDAQYVSAYQTLAPDPKLIRGYGCSIVSAGETTSGLIIQGEHNTVENSVIAHSSGNGVALLGGYNTVTNSVIYDVNSMGSYAAGVEITGNHQTVTHNTIYRSGRSGITVDWHVNGLESLGNNISYNDISQFSRLNTDNGAIYVCCKLDMAGTTIDHNWLHTATPLPGGVKDAEVGLYFDNSSGNATAFDNVEWGDYMGASSNPIATFINGGSGNKLYNNDGEVQGGGGSNTVENNIGTVNGSGPGISHNLSSSVNPDYVDPARNNYQLAASSPARNVGMFIPGVTVGGTDPKPSLGAYQYGGPFWKPGASRMATPPVASQIQVTPSSVSLKGGETETLRAVVEDQYLKPMRRRGVTWTSSDPSVAAVTPSGVVTALAGGTATITASTDSGWLTAAVPVSVAPSGSLVISAPASVTPDAAAIVRTTLTNIRASTAASAASVTLTVPSGWSATATSPSSTSLLNPGGSLVTTWSLSVPKSAACGNYRLSALGGLTFGGVRIPLSAQAVAYIPCSSLSAAFDNVGITSDSDIGPGNFDGAGHSFSAQALADANPVALTPGARVTVDHTVLAWPGVPAGMPDNVVAEGQTIDLSGSGSDLGFIGTAANANATGSGVITYTDGSSQPFTLSFGNWFFDTPVSGTQLLTTSSTWNSPHGSHYPVSLFFASVPLQPGKTVASVTLPDVSSGVGQAPNVIASMHIFAMAVGSGVPTMTGN